MDLIHVGLIIGIASGAAGTIMLVVTIICAYRIWWKPKRKLKKRSKTSHVDNIDMYKER